MEGNTSKLVFTPSHISNVLTSGNAIPTNVRQLPYVKETPNSGFPLGSEVYLQFGSGSGVRSGGVIIKNYYPKILIYCELILIQ